MIPWSTVGLGLRLAAGGGRKGWVRMLLMASGVGLGVALLVGGLGIAPALQARHGRELARGPVFPADPHPANYAPWMSSSDRIGDRDVVRFSVAAVGRAPIPPGLTRIPAPGQSFVSPELARVLDTPLGRIASNRYGDRVGTVGDDGLIYPSELVAYVGVPLASIKADGLPAIGFGSTAAPSSPVSFGIRLLILVGVAGLLVPIVVYVTTCTRLSAASRDRRLAAIRLVGATPAQARTLAAVESGLAAILGSAIGLGLFFAFRPLVAGLSLAGYRWFPQDIAPPVGQTVAVLLAAPALAMVASMASLRRLQVTPLGVARRARVRRSGAVRAVPLVLGLAGLVACWVDRITVNRGGAGSMVLLGVSFVLVLVGLAAVGPWLGAAVAPLVARGDRRLGALLGARRVQADPTAAGRVTGTMAVLMFGAGVVLAIIPSFRSSGAGDVAMALRPSSLLIEGTMLRTSRFDRALGGLDGVRAVVPLGMLEGGQKGSGDAATFDWTAWVADCTGLREALAVPFPGCTPDTGFASPIGYATLANLHPGSTARVALDGRDTWHQAILRVMGPMRRIPLEFDSWQIGTDVIVPPSWLSPSARRQLFTYRTLVVTDGNAATIERVRNAAVGLDPTLHVRSLEEAQAANARTAHQITALVDLGLLVALGIAMANLLIVSIDHVQERRLPVAMLAASGVPIGVLRRSIAVEIGVPLISAIALAVALAVAVGRIFGGIVAEPVGLGFGSIAALAGVTLVTVALVTALTLPTLSRAARPETLRIE